jgi:hypothetical protein
MTAPFNPTELARKAAERHLEKLVFVDGDRPTREEAIADLAERYLDAARDLIAQSGIKEALDAGDVIASYFNPGPIPANNPTKADCDFADHAYLNERALKSLRSITEAERGGVES